MKYKRYTVNVPIDLAAMIDARIPECPYDGASAYFLALAIYDCWCRREHKLTVKLMALPPKAKDEAFDRFHEEFKKQSERRAAGKETADEQKLGWFDHLIQKIVEEKIKEATPKAPLPKRKTASKSSTPIKKKGDKRDGEKS